MSRSAWKARLRRQAKRIARAAALVDEALAKPLPRLVLVKGDRKILLSRNTYGAPYRITWFDKLGPSMHLEFSAADRAPRPMSMDSEIASALYNRFRVERKAA